MVTGSKVNVSCQCPHVACRYSPDCSSRAGAASPWIGRFPTWRPSHSRAQPHSPRGGRGSLSGKLTVAPDWTPMMSTTRPPVTSARCRESQPVPWLVDMWPERTWAAGGAGAGGHYQEGASRWERALVRRSPRSTATGASAVPAPAGGHRSPQRICPRRARLIPADCRPAGSASLFLRAAAHRGRATAHHRR